MCPGTGYTRADMVFHNAIIESGGNRSIGRVYPHTIGPPMALRTTLFTALNALLGRSMDKHTRLIEACRDRGADRAAAIAREHIFHLIEDFEGLRATPRPRAKAPNCSPGSPSAISGRR
ncbi:FCD domain-containing protein [Pararhodobacter sp.]|uniref:FCD domain-containing protein n=1 Tax=Pararhodobacter sp. TaxID=2127056 RepID=UPI002AFDC9E5|nr:FCD domain-containing protein [Pararhodobacter sp.]